MRKLIAFDEDTYDKLRQLGRDRMGMFQELAEKPLPTCSRSTASRST